MSKHECTIVIDTNQFCSDMMLSGLRWRCLIEYLKKTNACLQMPTIVWQEIYRNYSKTICGYYSDIRKFTEKLDYYTNPLHEAPCISREISKIRAQKNYFNTLPPQTTNDLAKAYLSKLKLALGLETKDFIEADKAWFDKIISRSINHEKPFSEESDKGFKDTLLWMSILSLKDRPGFIDHPIVFISSNSRDFGCSSEKGKLHPSLHNEARLAGLDIHYYDNIDAFTQDWASDITSIDTKKINNLLTEKIIKNVFLNPLSKLMRKNESVENNIFITGTNFKIESATKGKQIIRASVSGYLTNTETPFPYFDFNAEIVYHEDREDQQITIETLNFPEKALVRQLWPEEEVEVRRPYPFLNLYGGHLGNN